MTLTNTQKVVLFILTAALFASLTVAAWAVAKWGFARSSSTDAVRTITVADSAETKTAPDTAFVTFGVVVKNKVARAAARINATRTSTVVAALRKAGVPKTDIKTVDYSVEPESDWNKTPPKIVGYTASNSVRVRTKSLEKIGDMIDVAVSAGANSVQGVSFDVEDKKALRGKALALAVKKAQGKAEAIAEALGAKLGPAVSASESVNMYAGESRNYVGRASAMKAKVATPIEPGETTVSAQVKVVYSLR